MKKFTLDEIRLAKLPKKDDKQPIVAVFGFDKIEQKAICAKFSMKEKKLCLSKVLPNELTIFNIVDNVQINKEENEDVMGVLAYLMHVGLELSNWNSEWNISNWDLLTKN
tara:strand:+ start:175 stop:504 length:330 start_codon:yes stop_codon:yes gene_type:complete